MVSLSNHVAISLRLNTHGRTAVATATRLPTRHRVRGRNDKPQPPPPRILSLSSEYSMQAQSRAGDCRRLIQHTIIGQGPVFGRSQTYYLHQAVLRVWPSSGAALSRRPGVADNSISL